MGFSVERLKNEARMLAAKVLCTGFILEAVHEYIDTDGNQLFWRIRCKHPVTGEKWIRPMKSEDGIFSVGEPKISGKKPLYNLYQVSVRPGDPVVVVEGEWCVDALTSCGVLTTTSGAANSAEKADWTPLSGRAVTVWPDNDEVGITYAETVVHILSQLGCSVSVVDVHALNLPPKGDVVDWISENPNAKVLDFSNLPLKPLHFQNAEEEPVINENVEDAEEGGKKSQASVLVAFVEEKADLFHDPNKHVYARDKNTKETRRLDSRQFRDWLVAEFYHCTGQSPREQAVREALSTLAGLGRYRSECHEAHIRVAMHEGAYFLDVGEPGQSLAVKVEAGKWSITDDPPVRFIRPETLRPLPIPVHNGDINKLWEVANIPEDARLLVLAWLVESLRPNTPFPILELIGEQGSAKSTTQAVLRRLIDPNACDLRAAPKCVDDIFVSAGVNWLVSYENISQLSAQMQDALCVLATGGGIAKRKLYSDAEETVINVKRPVVLNGISVAVTAQDLVDRTISVEAPAISARAESTDIWNTFEAEYPRLLGALMDIMADALALLPHIALPPSERPRLAEFARFGMAIAEAYGQSGGDFMSQFTSSRRESIARTIDASPVASAVMDWFQERGGMKANLPLKELFADIERHKPANCDAWPRSPKGFGDALRRNAPALRHFGIECKSQGKTGGSVRWTIEGRKVS